MSLNTRLKAWAKRIKRDGVTLWFAARHPRTPWYAKALGLFVVAYALSPIDLIPDFIPILGYVDDVLLLPALMWVVLLDCRGQAEVWLASNATKPRSWLGAILIVVLWMALAVAAWFWWFQPQ